MNGAPIVLGARLGAALAGLVTVAVPPAGAVAAGVADPPVAQSVTLDRASVAVGETLTVELSGWPAGAAQVELCGNAARRGTVDCDRLGATATRVGADGTGSARLVVGRPPAACPCVVRVDATGVGATTAVPIEITGLPADERTGTLGVGAMEAVRTIEVVATSIAPDERNAAVLGFGVGRRIDVTLRNAGTVALSDVTVSGVLSGWGASSQPVAGPAPFTLAPGVELQVSIAVELPVPAFGDYRFVGRVDGGDQTVGFSVSTDHVPWGLVNAVVLGVAAALVFAARRSRRPGSPPTAHAPAPQRDSGIHAARA